MFRLVLAQLTHRLGRTIALLTGILVATTSFTVLTSAAETSELRARGRAQENFRSSYDLLVRPPDSFTALERSEGLVRPNYQSGIFGGVSLDQLRAIRRTPGVEIAAPVANIGFVLIRGSVEVKVPYDRRGPVQQLFRVTPTWTADNGLSQFPGQPSYVYVSRNRVIVAPYEREVGGIAEVQPTYFEKVPGARKAVSMCGNYDLDHVTNPANAAGQTEFGYRSLYLPAGAGTRMSCFFTSRKISPPKPGVTWIAGANHGPVGRISIPVSFPVLLAAVDPAAEARMSRLDETLVSGRMLSSADRPKQHSDGLRVPVVAASRAVAESTVKATIDRVDPPAGQQLSDLAVPAAGMVERVNELTGSQVGLLPTTASSTVYGERVRGVVFPDVLFKTGPVDYEVEGDDRLRPKTVDNDDDEFASPISPQSAPEGSDDVGFRKVSGYSQSSSYEVGDTPVDLDVVGTFDPARASADAELSGVVSQTYDELRLAGADQRSRDLLGGRPLGPSTNLAGYLAQPPLMLTSLRASTPLWEGGRFSGEGMSTMADAPLSVVRVRVAGVTGTDQASRKLLDQTASRIEKHTGLQVDIVAGASGLPKTIVLPAGERGRPELELTENWAQKGVVYTLIKSVDRKSAVLFGLILLVCALVVGNAASAAVRTRRSELGVLATMGWRSWRLFAMVLGELAVVGAAAGAIGTALAVPVSKTLDFQVSGERALLALPAAVLLALLAGTIPALRASRSAPMDAIRPQVRQPRRPRPVRRMPGMVVSGVSRTPGRALLGAAALAVGVAALVVLVSLQRTFNGSVAGTLLGDALALEVRGADVVALAAIGVLAATGVADVLYLSVREQESELATLKATGWTNGALSRLVIGQGLVIGLVGSAIGGLFGGLAIGQFAGRLDQSLLEPVAIAAAAGIAVAVLASVVPSLLVRRLPTAALLSREEE